MPALPSSEYSPSLSIHSPSVKHNSSPYSSTASTPSASPSLSPVPIAVDSVPPLDEHKSIDHSAAAASIADQHPSLFPTPTELSPSDARPAVAYDAPVLPKLAQPNSLSAISPVLSSYAAYPPPLHPSMVNVVLSPHLQPQPPMHAELSQSQLAALHPPSAISTSAVAPTTMPQSVHSTATSMSVAVNPSEFASTPSPSTSNLSPSSTGTPSPASASPTTASPHGHHFSPHFSMFTCVLNPQLSVTCFRRGGPDGARLGPLFVVREFDAKVIRSSPKLARPHSTTANGEPSATSEQAFRASIRQAMLNMNLRPENASKSEIRVLKAQGILGKRAPSASLLTAEDMCRLLISFHKEECAKRLRDATVNWKEVEAQWLADQQRSTEPGAVVDLLSADFTAKDMPIGHAFTHVPLSKAESGEGEAEGEGEKGGEANGGGGGGGGKRVVVPHIIKVGEGIDEEAMAVDKGPTRTKAELKEIREREKNARREEKSQQREQKRIDREARKLEKAEEKEKKLKQRKRKADASPMLNAAPTTTAGLEALLSAVEDASTGVTVRGPSSMPNVIRALSTPPSVDGRSSMVSAGLSFRLPSAAVRSVYAASSQSLPLYAPMPRRPQTPVGFTSTLTSTSPSPTSISPTSTTFTTASAFSSPVAQPRPLVPPPHALLDRQHSGSTSPTGSEADERLAMVRVLSTDSERAERERTRMKLDGFGLAQMDEGKAEIGVEEDKRAEKGMEVVDKEMVVVA